jgi:hypothetical protein
MEGRPSNTGRLVGNFPQAFTHLALLKIPFILGIEGPSRRVTIRTRRCGLKTSPDVSLGAQDSNRWVRHSSAATAATLRCWFSTKAALNVGAVDAPLAIGMDD